jgi:manganese/zinc/iron transport system substrate-binding protein
MLGDAVEQIVGPTVKVIALMGPGVDPHLYKATQGDLKSLTNADVIVYNGLHLEGKMGEIFEKLEKQKHIIVATGGLTQNEYINNSEFQGAYDPHIWFDVALWSKAVQHIGNELAQLSTDSIGTVFKENTKTYTSILQQLNASVQQEVNKLDSSSRILITAHDAFGYFGRAYGFEVRGLQGISTTSEYGLKDVSDLVTYIVENEIKAVFVESSVSRKSLQAVVDGCVEKGHQVKIGGQLYSDAMGEKSSAEGSYVGMVKHNVTTVVEGLR